MYIESLYIKNFRSIDYLHLKLTKGKNVVVGKNNAGKSNIVKALDISFGSKNPLYTDVSYTDFHEHEHGPCEDFWILSQLRETDINEEELAKIKGVYRGKLKATPFRINEGQIDIVQEHTVFDPDAYYNNDYANKTYFKPKSNLPILIESIKKANSIMVLFYARSCNDLDTSYEKEYRFFYQEAVTEESGIQQKDAPWYVIWAISPIFRDALITSAILPAFREPANQLKPSNWSWYGKLLKKVWNEKKVDKLNSEDNIESVLKAALSVVEKIGNNVYNALARDISKKINIAFSDPSINFQYFHDPKEIYKQVQVFVNDGFNSNLQNKGSGIQSAVIIGLFSYYCTLFHQNTTILAIEEPELYLHPQARRVISNRLSEFVNTNPDKQNQVIVITHSTEFIKAGELNNISVIKKINGKTKSNFFNIQKENKTQIQTLLRSENSEMFFADTVIICEGGEKFILPTMVDKFVKSRELLDEYNITIVRANGKNDIFRIADALRECGIPYYALADLDFLFEGLDHTLHPDIGSIRSDKTSIIDELESKYLQKRLLNPDKSIDAKSFCQKMDEVESDNSKLSELLNLWAYLRPKVKKKITFKDLENENNSNFRQKVYKAIDDIFNQHNLYILKRGELEDYLTPEGRKVDGTKETRLLNIKQLVEEGHSIEEYFLMDEFNYFFSVSLKSFLESVTPLVEPVEALIAQALLVPESTPPMPRPPLSEPSTPST
ncbi:ATP-dependent nuclease [Hymenobacter wooponensis]|uniref:ATP-dependent endonuclease n=1 Tax=Hymenobacter wooponensis TaxID=1525360 RepID=A0A4Z0MPF9_9BACT|nr:AAA family ATPase [Hymenobacter wooponensis]TGD81531.1 ATP-dependent endonuclease [Hymenobacter wooponensis]